MPLSSERGNLIQNFSVNIILWLWNEVQCIVLWFTDGDDFKEELTLTLRAWSE